MRLLSKLAPFTLLLVLFCTVSVSADEVANELTATAPAAVDPRLTPDKFNAANTAWMLTSSALVLMMTAPGLAMF
ncbi:MAG: ammonia channel protein, partial [Planctomycetota bacterium]|nr:ammonia channel protein [Planctomycetota bacterium]